MASSVQNLLDDRGLSVEEKLGQLFVRVNPSSTDDMRRILLWGLQQFGLSVGTGSMLWAKMSFYNSHNNNRFYSLNARSTTKVRHSRVTISPAEYPRLLDILEFPAADNIVQDVRQQMKRKVGQLSGKYILAGIGFGALGFPNLSINAFYLACKKEHKDHFVFEHLEVPVIWIGHLVDMSGTTPLAAGPAAPPPLLPPPPAASLLFIEGHEFCMQGALTSADKADRRSLLTKWVVEGSFSMSKTIGFDERVCAGDGIYNPSIGFCQGTFCLSVRPTESGGGYNSEKQYGLTNCHVAIAPSEYGLAGIQSQFSGHLETPGIVDRAKSIYVLLKNQGSDPGMIQQKEETIRRLLKQTRICGRAVVSADLGCFEMEGWNWRADWALFEIEGRALNEFRVGMQFEPGAPVIPSKITRCASNPAFKGEQVWKNGSRTGITEGKAAGSYFLCYAKSYMDQAADFKVQKEAMEGLGLTYTREQFENEVDECAFRQVLSFGNTDFAAPADSGGSVVKLEEGELAFEGLLSNLVVMHDVEGEKIGLYIPQHILFKNMERKTGVTWNLDS